MNKRPITCWGLLLYMPAGGLRALKTAVLWSVAVCQLQLVLQSLCAFQGRFGSCWLLAELMYTTERLTETALGDKWQSLWQLAVQATPSLPTGTKRWAFWFCCALWGWTCTLVFLPSFLHFITIMNKFISFLLRSLQSANGICSLLSKQNKIFCFLSQG